MAANSIRDRLAKLENKRRFLDWFVMDRFYANLTADELKTWARDGTWPDPMPNPPRSAPDLKKLIKRWEEEERIFVGRNREELDSYAKHGFWPEQKGRLHYFLQDGKLVVEWRREPDEEGT